MWQRLSIAKKIWLSLSILIIGYMISTGIGFILGRQTESRLHNVSEYLFPASTQSQLALLAFEEQIKYYNDLIMIGNMGNAIEASQKKAEEVLQALEKILRLKWPDRQKINDVQEIYNQLKIFNVSALSTYIKIKPDAEYVFESEDKDKSNLENEIFLTGQQTNNLRDRLAAISKKFSDDLNFELAAIGHSTKNYRYLNMGIFLCTLLILVAIVSLILSKYVLDPINRLTHGTKKLASLKFETEINVHSGDEMGQLAENFNNMAQTLRRYEQMQRQWISDITHELRTPLSILQGEIEAIQDGIREMNKEELDSLYSEVIYLRKIVNDLLQLSLAEAGTLHFKNEPVNPIRTLRDTMRLFHNSLTDHQISIKDNLDADQDIFILGDADRLKQLFSNLFDNVLRYTESPGSLMVWQQIKDGSLTLYIQDSGPGVPEEALERLFDRLYRVDKSRSRSKGGSGLGLAICRHIVETHRGVIRAQNAPSSGLRIEVEFPIYLD